MVALAWVLSKPFVTAPIIGASKPHHLADACAALELKLDAATIAKLEAPYRPKAVVGHYGARASRPLSIWSAGVPPTPVAGETPALP